MKQYNVGDEVWHAHYDNTKVQKPCPVCFGQKRVTLILGDGERVSLDCDYCGHGLEGPRGFITEYEWIAKAECLKITKVSTETDAIGEQREYYTGPFRVHIDDLFNTEEEALARCKAKVAQKALEESTLASNIKAHKLKSYSWNAGYHLRQAEDHRRRIEYHEQKAILCQERAK